MKKPVKTSPPPVHWHLLEHAPGPDANPSPLERKDGHTVTPRRRTPTGKVIR